MKAPKEKRKPARQISEVGSFLQAEKEAACNEVVRGIHDPMYPWTVSLGGEIIASIVVAVLRESKDRRSDIVAFVHLTDAGRQMVEIPWSPRI